MTNHKADARLAGFLRQVLAGDNDVAAAEVIYGANVTDIQVSLAHQFASAVRDQGYIESAGATDELQRVRVTEHGRAWLDEYEQRPRTDHPRFSS